MKFKEEINKKILQSTLEVEKSSNSKWDKTKTYAICAFFDFITLFQKQLFKKAVWTFNFLGEKTAL